MSEPSTCPCGRRPDPGVCKPEDCLSCAQHGSHCACIHPPFGDEPRVASPSSAAREVVTDCCGRLLPESQTVKGDVHIPTMCPACCGGDGPHDSHVTCHVECPGRIGRALPVVPPPPPHIPVGGSESIGSGLTWAPTTPPTDAAEAAGGADHG